MLADAVAHRQVCGRDTADGGHSDELISSEGRHAQPLSRYERPAAADAEPSEPFVRQQSRKSTEEGRVDKDNEPGR